MYRTKSTSTLTTIFLLAFFAFANVQPVSSRSFESSKIQNTPYPYVPDVILLGVQEGVTLESNPQDVPGQPYKTDSTALDFTLNSLGIHSLELLFASEQVHQTMLQSENSIDLTRVYRVQLGAGTDVMGAVETLTALPEVTFAEPDYIAFPADVPASGYAELSGQASYSFPTNQLTIDDPLYSQQWGLAKINIEGAWSSTYGSSTVAIAIIDSGIDLTHVDLSGNLWVNPGEIANNGLDDDSNGYIDDVNGWNFVSENKDVSDDNGHGTLVSGVAAAIGGNRQGIVGACPQCRIMPVKVMQASGTANYSDIAAGILYAAQKGAKVINLSLGGYANSNILKNAIDTAVNTYGAVVVAGAGNDNLNQPFYPAAYDNVLAVAGTQSDDTKVGTSNYAAWVDVSAPGINIRTTALGGGWVDNSGTSFAAPFSSGLAGLLRSLHPEWSANLTRAQIVNTTDSIDSVNPSYAGMLGSGRINAQKAMTTVATPFFRYVSYIADGTTNAPLKAGATSAIAVTLVNDWKDASSVVATLSTTSSDMTITDASGSWSAIASGQSVTNSLNTFQVSVPAGKYGLNIPFTLNIVADGINSTVTFNATTESVAVNISGAIASNATWTNDRIYHVTGNTVVNPGVTLTIQPGTTVKFDSAKLLAVRGTLIADGTLNQPILFTAWSPPNYGSCTPGLPCPGEWGGSYQSSPSGGTVFTAESQPAQFDVNGNYQSGSIIRYAVVEYSFGGIQLQSAAPFIDHNLIHKNRDTAIGCGACSSQLVISNNRIINNNAMFVLNLVYGQAKIRQNLIANNAGGLRAVGGQEVISNTITGNTGFNCLEATGAVCLEGPGATPTLQGNNIYGNSTPYEIVMGTGAGQIGDVNAPGNYWGTTDSAAIQARIYDFNQNSNAGIFTFTPFLAAPDPITPPFLYQLSLIPGSPVGIQQVAFSLTFSTPMDQSIDPTITFGATSPYADYSVLDSAQWLNDRTWSATYDITSLVPRGTYTISVSGAKGTDGMEIPTDTRFSFIVDYVGSISDTTPPLQPNVSALWNGGHTSISASWSSSDPESAITMYRYAIGTNPGTRDVVDWTYTNNTSVTHSGLNLSSSITYYVSVGARNEGGLWSNSGIEEVVTFADVPATYWARQYIERLYGAGITGGCSTGPLMYCPENAVTRAQMAVFLEKGIHGSSFTPPTVPITFNDTAGNWAQYWIEALRSDGITSGCAAGLYCPNSDVTRAQMAVFLLKSKYGSSYSPPSVGAGTGFTDVPSDYWAAAWIKQLAAEGITGGCGTGLYCPDNPVTRAQMAVFLVKAFNLP